MIFVAIPYYHFDKEVSERRTAMLAKYCGDLLSKGVMCTSPVLLGVTVLNYCHLPSDFDFWDKLSYAYLDTATELHVLILPGWQESRGVQSEIAYAQKREITIRYIDVSDWQYGTVKFYETDSSKRRNKLKDKLNENYEI